MERVRWLMNWCEENQMICRHDGETDVQVTIRMFREKWNGGEFLLEVLATVTGISLEEVVCLAEGTLWVADEPDGVTVRPLEERKEEFLQKLLGTSYRPQTMAA